MKKKNIFQLILSGLICLLGVTSCSIEPDFYSQVVPETFYGLIAHLLTGAGISLMMNLVGRYKNWELTNIVYRHVVATGMMGQTIRSFIIMNIRKT